MRLTVRPTGRRRDGYVIFAVLIVVVVLSLVAYRFAESMTGEYRAGVRTADGTRAKLAAVSGLHYAAAVLADRDTFFSELDGNPFDNPDIFQRVEISAAAGGATQPPSMCFDIRCVALTDGGGFEQRFGVIDEGGKLNINSMIALDPTGQVLHDALMKLPNMTEDVADAIVDWVDADDDARASGAESSYYQSLSNPYKAKNGPLNSLDELLLVRGVTPELLYGGDRNRNGVQDEGDTGTDRGWSDYLTVYGRELNVDMSGTARIYLNGDDLDTLYKQLQGAVGDDLAAYIVASKVFTAAKVSGSTGGSSGGGASGSVTTNTSTSGGTTTVTVTVNGTGGTGGSGQSQRQTVTATTDQLYAAVQAKIAVSGSSGTRVRSLTDLMGTKITLPRAPDAKPTDPDLVAYSPLSDPARLNDLLPKLLDKTTVRQAIEMVPRINVNTAPREVLMAVPTLTDAEAGAIVGARANQVPTDPATVSAAWLVTTSTLSPDRYKAIEKYITGSTMVYRVQSVGYSAGGGTTARMEAVIDINQGSPRFLHIRDLSDLENPRGFEPSAAPGP